VKRAGLSRFHELSHLPLFDDAAQFVRNEDGVNRIVVEASINHLPWHSVPAQNEIRAERVERIRAPLPCGIFDWPIEGYLRPRRSRDRKRQDDV
jgi:hypothetical protein